MLNVTNNYHLIYKVIYINQLIKVLIHVSVNYYLLIHLSLYSSPSLLSSLQSGYTLLCEMWSLKESVDISDKLHLTMISSYNHLPTFSHETSDDKLSTDFHTTTIRNYYLPDRYYTMLRYSEAFKSVFIPYIIKIHVFAILN